MKVFDLEVLHGVVGLLFSLLSGSLCISGETSECRIFVNVSNVFIGVTCRCG